jgi:hypothetical protein
MQTCKKCGVTVAGDKRCCPLCQGELVGAPEREAFPQQPAPKYDRGMLKKLLNFITIVAMAVCLVVEFAFTRGEPWIWFAVAGIVSGWFTIQVALTFRGRIFKNLTCLLLVTTVLCLIWDSCVGWKGWSVDYVLPICCLATLLSQLILAWALHAQEQEYMIHLIIVTVYSLLPFVLLCLGRVGVLIPTVICSLAAFLMIAVLLVFKGKAFFAELARRMHI